MGDWRDDILEEAAEDREEPRGPKAVRPKNWRAKRKKRRKATQKSRCKNR